MNAKLITRNQQAAIDGAAANACARNALLESMASLAGLMNLSPSDAIGLPAVIERASIKVCMPMAEFLFRCHNNAELRAYLAPVAKLAAAELRKAP